MEAATEALKISSATAAVLSQHLIECRDRYLSLYGLVWKATGALIAILLGMVAYLVSKGGLPGVH